MAKLSLLDMTQDILNDMDSDEVNSINDSVESLQVAQIINTTYFEIMADGKFPHLGGLLQLTASGNTAKPTHMTMGDDVQYIEWIKYNTRTSTDTKDIYTAMTYEEPQAFIERVNSRDNSLSTVTTVADASGINLNIINDTAPKYYTSFDEEGIVFDSHDSALDSTLQASKIQVYGYREPVFTLADDFVADLPSKAFPYFLAEAKSVCFNALKQAANPKEEQRADRQRKRLSGDRWRLEGGVKYPNYGRKGKK